jgi:integrase
MGDTELSTQKLKRLRVTQLADNVLVGEHAFEGLRLFPRECLQPHDADDPFAQCGGIAILVCVRRLEGQVEETLPELYHREIRDRRRLFRNLAVPDVPEMKAGYAPKTIDHIHDVLSAVLRTAVEWGHLQVNPAREVDLPTLRCVRPKWALTTAQAAALLEALPALPKAMAGLAILTGLRRGELFALRWKDLDLAERSLTVREAVYEGNFDTPKTTAALRRVPLSAAAVQLLETWQRRVTPIEPEALVFATWSGKSISPNNVLKPIVAAAKALELPKVSWLTFRRTYSSWAHDKGVPAKVVATLMGHAKVDTTLNVYTQVLDHSVRGAAEKVGSELITIDHKSEATSRLKQPEA